MASLFAKTDHALKAAGVTGSRLRYEETLNAGFVFGMWCRARLRPNSMSEDLTAFLGRLNLRTAELIELPDDQNRLAMVSASLERERDGLGDWFQVGLWTFATTWILGEEKYAATTEAARSLIRDDDEVRKSSSSLLDQLIKIGWSPDEAENFYLQKIVPFLYEEDLRKWVRNPEMAPMHDLRYKARQLDLALKTDSDSKRLAGALRALIAEIPVAGKALEIMIFGTKKEK